MRVPPVFAAASLLAVAGCGDGSRPSLSAVYPPTIRVQLGEPRESASLVVADAWDVSSEAGTSFEAKGRGLVTALAAGPGGIVFRGVPTGASAIRLRTSDTFSLGTGPARCEYRGDLLVRQEGARLRLVDEVDLEAYVAGVVVNEMGNAQAPAAYRTQAVVARCYAYVRWRADPAAAVHVHDGTRSQVYRGVTLPAEAGIAWDDVLRCVAATRGVVLTWRSEPFPTYYHSTCGGHTSDPETAGLDPGGASEPLRGVPCRWCTPSKYYAWTEELPTSRLLEGLRARGVVAPISAVDWTKTGRGGFVAEATLTFGPKGAKKVVPGHAFREAARLRSMKIDSAEATPAGLLVRGHGWGHGVGLCQVGAQEMARQGFDETQILRWYYPGAEFTRLY
jgi:stage II sporulation protein D